MPIGVDIPKIKNSIATCILGRCDCKRKNLEAFQWEVCVKIHLQPHVRHNALEFPQEWSENRG